MNKFFNEYTQLNFNVLLYPNNQLINSQRMNLVSNSNLLKLNLITSKKLIAAFMIMIAFLQSGCEKTDTSQKENDDALIKNYLLKKNITATKI